MKHLPTTVWAALAASLLLSIRAPAGETDLAADLIRGIVRLDFGPADENPTLPGFLALHPRSLRGTRAIGWAKGTDPKNLRAQANSALDPLAGDRIVIAGKVTLELDLKSGPCKLWILLADGPNPGARSAVSAGGSALWSRTWTAKTFASDKGQGLYRLRGALWKPGRKPLDLVDMARREMTLDLIGMGRETKIQFENVAVCALALYPVAEEARMASDLRKVQAAREAALEGRVVLPDPLGPPLKEPTAQEMARGAFIFVRPIDVPLYPTSRPDLTERTTNVSLTAARGETTSVAIGIIPVIDPGANAQMTVSPGPLTGPGKHRVRAEDVQIRAVRYYERPIGGGKYCVEPYLLEPASSVPLHAGMAASFWITIHVPKEMPPANYTGQALLAFGKLHIEMNIELTVLGMELLDDPEILTVWRYLDPTDARWNYRDSAFSRDRARRRARIGAEIRDLRAHGANAVFVPSPRILSRTADGLLWDFSGAPDETVAALDAAGFPREAPLLVDGEEAARKIQAQGFALGSRRFEMALEKFLGLAASWVSEKGRPGYLVVADRMAALAAGRTPADGRTIARLLEIARRSKRFKRLLVLDSDTIPGLKGEPGDLILGGGIDAVALPPHATARELRAAAMSQGGPAIWYAGGGAERVSFGLFLWKYREKVGGRLGPVYARHALPYDPFANDAGYAYPSPAGPVSTVPFELALLGVNDRRYVRTLEHEIALVENDDSSPGTREARRSRARAKEIVAEAKKTLQDIVVKLPLRYLDPRSAQGGVSPARLWDWRRKLAQAIVLLRRERGAKEPEVQVEQAPVVEKPSSDSAGPDKSEAIRKKKKTARLIGYAIIGGALVLVVVLLAVYMRRKR